MGYSTIYLRPFYFDRPIEPEHAKILNEFSETEHEDESGNPGGEGKPPTYYCQWIVGWSGIKTKSFTMEKSGWFI
jgi:hypothetical protein